MERMSKLKLPATLKQPTSQYLQMKPWSLAEMEDDLKEGRFLMDFLFVLYIYLMASLGSVFSQVSLCEKKAT